MNYEEMSDFEINKRVAAALGHELTQCSISNIGLQTVIKEPVGNDWVPAKIPDYCNNPADAWPIIVDNEICIDSSILIDGWRAKHAWEEAGCLHDNPLRAAMICYLMMQEAK